MRPTTGCRSAMPKGCGMCPPADMFCRSLTPKGWGRCPSAEIGCRSVTPKDCDMRPPADMGCRSATPKGCGMRPPPGIGCRSVTADGCGRCPGKPTDIGCRSAPKGCSMRPTTDIGCWLTAGWGRRPVNPADIRCWSVTLESSDPRLLETVGCDALSGEDTDCNSPLTGRIGCSILLADPIDWRPYPVEMVDWLAVAAAVVSPGWLGTTLGAAVLPRGRTVLSAAK